MWNPIPLVVNNQILSASGYFYALNTNYNVLASEFTSLRPMNYWPQWDSVGNGKLSSSYTAGAGFCNVFNGRGRLFNKAGTTNPASIILTAHGGVSGGTLELAVEINGQLFWSSNHANMTYAAGTHSISITFTAAETGLKNGDYVQILVNARMVSGGSPLDGPGSTIFYIKHIYIDPDFQSLSSLPAVTGVWDKDDWNALRTGMNTLRQAIDLPIIPTLGNYHFTPIAGYIPASAPTTTDKYIINYQVDMTYPFHEPQPPQGEGNDPDTLRRISLHTFVAGISTHNVPSENPTAWYARHGVVITYSELDSSQTDLYFYDYNALKANDLLLLGSEAAWRQGKTAGYEIIKLISRSSDEWTIQRGFAGAAQVWQAKRQCFIVGENATLYTFSSDLLSGENGAKEYTGSFAYPSTWPRLWPNSYYVQHTDQGDRQRAVYWRTLSAVADVTLQPHYTALPEPLHGHTVGGYYINTDQLRSGLISMASDMSNLVYATFCPRAAKNNWGQPGRLTMKRKRKWLHVYIEEPPENEKIEPKIRYKLNGKLQDKSLPSERNQWIILDLDSFDKLFQGTLYELVDVHFAFEQDLPS